MTALRRYARLEAEGRYFDGRSARAQPVVLSFGERSLTITGRGDTVLAHWPLASLRALGEKSDATVHLVPNAQSDERLIVSDEAMIRAIETVCPDLHRRPVDRRGLARALGWTGMALAAVALVIVVVIPGLANQLAPLVPPDKEVALGHALQGRLRHLLAWDEEADAPPGFCVDREGVAALEKMVGRLDATEMPYPVRVAALDHSMENALALPGGHILLFRGLIEEAESPEEIAGVLAHEIAHVVHRDPTRGLLRTAGTAGILGLLVGDIFGGGVMAAASEAMLNASYQRDAERRADETAYRLLAEAGLPVSPLARFFERMREKHGDAGDGAFRYFLSHPGLAGRAERAAAADRIGDGTFRPVLTDREWAALKNICRTTAASDGAG